MVNIAIIAIALGMVMMLISIAAGLGLQVKIREKIALFNGHIEISNYDNNASQVSVKPIPIDVDFYPNFKAVPQVNHIQGVATKAGIIRTETDFEGIIVKGVGTDYHWDVFENYIQEGRLPNFNEALNNEVIISRYLANRLGFEIGDKVNTYFLKNETKFNIRSFKVVGIYESGYEEFDKAYFFTDIRHIQKLNKWKNGEVGSFELFIDDFDQLEATNIQVYNEIPPFLDSNSILDKFANIFQWLDLFDMNIVGIIAIMILVAGINMITAILVLILERTQLIGLLKAIGANNTSVRKIFMYNAAYIILKGLFWGNLIALSLIAIQHYFKVITLNPANYYVNTAPVFIKWHHILFFKLRNFNIMCINVMDSVLFNYQSITS